MAKTGLVEVPFHGDIIHAGRQEGKVYAPLAKLCDNLGLDYSSQLAKLKRKPWATLVMIAMVAADGKEREQVCLDRESMPMWLATIEANKVAPELKDKLLRYQRDAAKVLADHFLRPLVREDQHAISAGPDSEEDWIIRACNESARTMTMLAETRRVQLEMQARQKATEQQAARAMTTAQAALDTVCGNAGKYTVLAWHRRRRLDVANADAVRHGKRLSKMCRSRGIEMGTTSDQRFGIVNLYPETLMDEYFAEVYGRTPLPE